jgi:hypothetical protein
MQYELKYIEFTENGKKLEYLVSRHSTFAHAFIARRNMINDKDNKCFYKNKKIGIKLMGKWLDLYYKT